MSTGQIVYQGNTFGSKVPNVNIDNNLTDGNYILQRQYDTSLSNAVWSSPPPSLPQPNPNSNNSAVEMASEIVYPGSPYSIGYNPTLAGFFAQFSRSGSTHLPTTAAAFDTAFSQYLQHGTPITSIFANEYYSLIGASGSTGLSGTSSTLAGTDWAPLGATTPSNLIPALQTANDIPYKAVTTSDISGQFEIAFNQFLQHYQYPPANPQNPQDIGVVTPEDFFKQWYTFLTTTAFVPTDGNSVIPANMGVTSGDIASYRLVYNAYNPNGSDDDFNLQMKKFYYDQLKLTSINHNDLSTGYFIPSQAFGSWFDLMQINYGKAQNATAAPLLSSVDTASSAKVIILNQVFALLVQMIQTLQNVAAAQADQLSFLTSWQKAYVDEMNQIHVFTYKDGSYIGVDPDSMSSADDVNIRGDLNNINQNYIQQLTADRNLISDDAKAVQSYINQSNDAVTQQADLATAIIQQESTIMGSIFR